MVRGHDIVRVLNRLLIDLLLGMGHFKHRCNCRTGVGRK
jgi:hypothetical protein